ncbi:RNA-binding domain-containing protein [Adlercreutzia sp. ZJ138]|uniref:RNA-binding domain-containing protein n=1 Tax=Adlercreutzia sp. ZJ138 TaxID=2709405 RepID=UPI0013EAD3FB|nr:RNA-binding domain-containing protein [Adlercreutzia sp. ZJ138]
MNLDQLDTYKESNRLEVKAAQGGIPRSVWESVCAFANSSGGIIVLGAKERDNGTLEVVGLSDAHKMLDDFWNAALSKDKLSARFLREEDAFIESLGDKEIVVIEVPRVNRFLRPVFLNKDILGETWRRTHTGDHRCTREEIQSMLRDAEAISDDSRVVEDAKISYIDFETLRKYRNRFAFRNEGHIWNEASNEDFLMFLGAAGEDREGVLRPTYAGMLMFGRDCWITRFLPNYFLDYRQETSSDVRWEDRFVSFSGDWSGNIYDFYIKVYNKLKAALKVPFKLEGIERVDDTPAHVALREALVNCVTNANYHERQGIVCVWNNDALLLTNPGGFRIPIERAMRPGESDPRNATMLKMFAMIDAGERAGSGISKILSGWREAGYVSPSYEEEYSPDRTVLKLPLTRGGGLSAKDEDSLMRSVISILPPDVSSSLNDNECIAVKLAIENGRITTAALAKHANVSKLTANRVLKGLADSRILTWRGKNPTDPMQYYELFDKSLS